MKCGKLWGKYGHGHGDGQLFFESTDISLEILSIYNFENFPFDTHQNTDNLCCKRLFIHYLFLKNSYILLFNGSSIMKTWDFFIFLSCKVEC